MIVPFLNFKPFKFLRRCMDGAFVDMTHTQYLYVIENDSLLADKESIYFEGRHTFLVWKASGFFFISFNYSTSF